VHRDFCRRFNTEANLVASDIDDRYDNVVTNNDAFVALPGQDKHRRTPFPPDRLNRDAP